MNGRKMFCCRRESKRATRFGQTGAHGKHRHDVDGARGGRWPLIASFEAGNVSLKRGAAWLHAYIEEMTGFPNASHDDQVDGSSGAFNKCALGVRWEWD